MRGGGVLKDCHARKHGRVLRVRRCIKGAGASHHKIVGRVGQFACDIAVGMEGEVGPIDSGFVAGRVVDDENRVAGYVIESVMVLSGRVLGMGVAPKLDPLPGAFRIEGHGNATDGFLVVANNATRGHPAVGVPFGADSRRNRKGVPPLEIVVGRGGKHELAGH